MASLYELTTQYEMIQQLALEEGADFSLALDQIQDDMKTKLDSYAIIIRNFEAENMALKDERDRLNARIKSNEKGIERMKKAVTDALMTVEGNRLKTTKFTFGFRKSTQVKIDDETVIPPQFLAAEVKVLKKDIAQAIKNGVEVDGAKLVENKSLSIR